MIPIVDYDPECEPKPTDTYSTVYILKFNQLPYDIIEGKGLII